MPSWSLDSSVGRAQDWRSWGPVFDSQSRQSSFYSLNVRLCFLSYFWRTNIDGYYSLIPCLHLRAIFWICVRTPSLFFLLHTFNFLLFHTLWHNFLKYEYAWASSTTRISILWIPLFILLLLISNYMLPFFSMETWWLYDVKRCQKQMTLRSLGFIKNVCTHYVLKKGTL